MEWLSKISRVCFQMQSLSHLTQMKAKLQVTLSPKIYLPPSLFTKARKPLLMNKFSLKMLSSLKKALLIPCFLTQIYPQSSWSLQLENLSKLKSTLAFSQNELGLKPVQVHRKTYSSISNGVKEQQMQFSELSEGNRISNRSKA